MGDGQLEDHRHVHEGERDACEKKRKIGRDAKDDIITVKEEDDVPAMQEETQKGRVKGASLTRLLALHREKDNHRKLCDELQRRITRDEEDVGRLLMLASQYTQAAQRRAEMGRMTREQKEEEQRLYDEKTKVIEDLQRGLDARGGIIIPTDTLRP